MKRTWTRLSLGVAVTGATLALNSTAVAGDDEQAGKTREAKLAQFLAEHPEADADGNGTLTIEEFREFRRAGSPGGGPVGDRPAKAGQGHGFGRPDPAQVLKAHPELDTNKDGTLSEEEMRAGKAIIAQDQLQEAGQRILAEHPEADTDGDGKLSSEEFRAFREASVRGSASGWSPAQMQARLLDWLIDNFAQADTDGSGELSKDELTKLKARLPELGLGKGPLGAGLGKGVLGAKPGQGASGPGGPNAAPAATEQGQTPGTGATSGKGSAARHGKGGGAPSRETLLQRFPAADTDGDGTLSDEEIKAFKEQRRGKGAGRAGKGAASGG